MAVEFPQAAARVPDRVRRQRGRRSCRPSSSACAATRTCSSTPTTLGGATTSRPSCAAIRSCSPPTRIASQFTCASTRPSRIQSAGRGRAAVRRTGQAARLHAERAQVPAGVPGAVPAHAGLLQQAEELNLLEPMQAEVTLALGRSQLAHRLSGGEPRALKALPGDKLRRARQDRRAGADLPAPAVAAQLRAAEGPPGGGGQGSLVSLSYYLTQNASPPRTQRRESQTSDVHGPPRRGALSHTRCGRVRGRRGSWPATVLWPSLWSMRFRPLRPGVSGLS